MTPHFINVNRHTLARNRKRGENAPALSARRGRHGRPSYARVIPIRDGAGNVVARVVQRPDNPLPCGATVYIECLYPPGVCDGDAVAAPLAPCLARCAPG